MEEIIRVNAPFICTKECIEAFETLKKNSSKPLY